MVIGVVHPVGLPLLPVGLTNVYTARLLGKFSTNLFNIFVFL